MKALAVIYLSVAVTLGAWGVSQAHAYGPRDCERAYIPELCSPAPQPSPAAAPTVPNTDNQVFVCQRDQRGEPQAHPVWEAVELIASGWRQPVATHDGTTVTRVGSFNLTCDPHPVSGAFVDASGGHADPPTTVAAFGDAVSDYPVSK